MTFVESKKKELSYRDYKHFNHECFEKNLKYVLRTFVKINYQEFDKTFIEILNKYASMNKLGSLYGKNFTQSNYKNIRIIN